jgi:uncharacterized protein
MVVIALIFIVAGLVKGVTGMGLPTVAMGLLGLTMAPAEAAAMLVIPSLVTNVWQFAAGKPRLPIVRRLWPMLLAIVVVTWAATGLITGGAAGQATTWLGVALIVYAAVALANVRLSLARPHESWLSPVVGAATGVVTGATGVLVIPAVPYLQALGLNKDELVQALGLSFTASTVALAAGLASRDALHVTGLMASVLCTLPALLGMWVGGIVRAQVNPATFRLIFLIGMIVLGADLAARSLA